jgi:hypothetical protein
MSELEFIFMGLEKIGLWLDLDDRFFLDGEMACISILLRNLNLVFIDLSRIFK